MFHLLDQNTGDLLEAFRTQNKKKQIREPKALSSGQIVPKKTTKRKVRNALIKVYVNGALLLIVVALVFVAYRLAVIPQLFPPEVSADDKTEQAPKVESKDYQGAGTFATFFAYYWLLGDVESASNYVATGYVFPENVVSPISQKVSWTRIWEVNPVDKDKVNIVVQALIETTSNNNQDQDQQNQNDQDQNNQNQNQNDQNQQENTEQTTSSQIVYLSVPLVVQDGRYGVYDIPTFLPTPTNASFKDSEKKPAPITPQDREAIKSHVQLFLDDYFGGNTEKLAIYFQDSKPRRTLENAKFTGIKDEMEILQVEENNSNQAKVKVVANATIHGKSMMQKFELEMVKVGKDWKIKKTNPKLPISQAVKSK